MQQPFDLPLERPGPQHEIDWASGETFIGIDSKTKALLTSKDIFEGNSNEILFTSVIVKNLKVLFDAKFQELSENTR